MGGNNKLEANARRLIPDCSRYAVKETRCLFVVGGRAAEVMKSLPGKHSKTGCPVDMTF